jgi:hypothetical protein
VEVEYGTTPVYATRRQDLTQINTQHFVLADPRTFEGDPYEVADRALKQAAAMARLLTWATERARLMARNAEMERQLSETGACDAETFGATLVAQKIDKVLEDAKAAEKNLIVLSKAASFNPKARIGR